MINLQLNVNKNQKNALLKRENQKLLEQKNKMSDLLLKHQKVIENSNKNLKVYNKKQIQQK